MALLAELLDAGLAHHQAGRLAEAEALYRQVLGVNPNQPDAWHLLGLIARRRGKQAQAIQYLQNATALNPSFPEGHYNLGNAFSDVNDWDNAAASYRRALVLDSRLAEAHISLGSILRKKGDLDQAVACYRNAVELRPDDADARNDLGVALHDKGEYSAAIECCCQALALRPNYAEAHHNIGRSLKEMGECEEAIVQFRQALELKPDLVEAHAGLGTLLLLRGDFQQGWSEYEWRWKSETMKARAFGRPTWEGQSLLGKTVLLHSEQGLGDTFEFIRYAACVKELGATTYVECQRPLTKILASCRFIDRLIARGDELPAFDFQSPLLSLPRLLKTSLNSIPATVPYIFADPALVARWSEILEDVRGVRIGINWRGREGEGAYRRRDIPLDCFVALAQIPGVRLISLQKGGRQDLAGAANSTAIFYPGDDVDTISGPFMDTAAIMKNLDLVITSDTSIPHLAGALGVPVWLALPFVPDWRWLQNRQDNPWYPTMRLFRQKWPGDWIGVFSEIRTALIER
jgi:tetratricopeptide (TPR) repeat protein